MKSRIFLSMLTLASMGASAAEEDHPWTVSGGVTYRESKFTLPSNRYKSESWTESVSALRRIDERNYVGVALSYGNAKVDYSTVVSRRDIDTTAVGLFLMHDFGNSYLGDLSVGYGMSSIDSSNGGTYNGDASSTSVALGISKVIPVQKNLNAVLSARYTYMSSQLDASTGIPEETKSMGFLSLGGRLNWQVEQWRPFVRLNWNVANREFQVGTGDKNYFSYGAGVSYMLSRQTSVGLSVGSVFDKAYSHEMNAGLNLSHHF
jgi:hypothetical protein